MIKLECIHADTCLTDYWSGRHLAHIAVPVWRSMTIGELRNEIQQGAVCGNNDDARLLSADMVRPDEEKRANALTRAAIRRDVKMNRPGARHPFRDIEQESDNDTYFVFREA